MKKKKNHRAAAIVTVIAIGVITYWLWPAEAPAPEGQPAPIVQRQHVEAPAPQPAPEEQDTMRVSFINHLGDANVTFTVDGNQICTANAGKACYGDVPFGKHVVEAVEAGKVIRTLGLTLDKNTVDPRVVVCFPTSPDC